MGAIGNVRHIKRLRGCGEEQSTQVVLSAEKKNVFEIFNIFL